MKDGNISNVPAPTVSFDGATFVSKSLLSYQPRLGWDFMLQRFYREYTVHLWFDPGWFIRWRRLDRSHPSFRDLWFNDIVVEPLRDMAWRLHKTRSRIISGRETFIKQCPNVAISIGEPMEKLRAAI